MDIAALEASCLLAVRVHRQYYSGLYHILLSMHFGVYCRINLVTFPL